jgi:hypothetical protein
MCARLVVFYFDQTCPAVWGILISAHLSAVRYKMRYKISAAPYPVSSGIGSSAAVYL